MEKDEISDCVSHGVLNGESPFAIRPMNINGILIVSFGGDRACWRPSQGSTEYEGAKGECNHCQFWEESKNLSLSFFQNLFLSAWSPLHHSTLSLTIRLPTRHKLIGKIVIKSESMGSSMVCHRLLTCCCCFFKRGCGNDI